MKKQVYEIDNQGYIKEIYVAEVVDGEILDEDKKGFIILDPPDGLYRAKWTGEKWIEDMPQEEIDELNKFEHVPTEMDILREQVDLLEVRQDSTEPLVERVKTASEIYQENVDKMDILMEDLRTLRIEKLKEECSQAIYDGFFVGENHFGFNEHDQANFTQQLLLVVAGQSSPIHWKTKNKGVIELTADEFKAVCQAAEVHKRSEQEKYWTLEQQILAATTAGEIKAVEW